MFDFDAVYRRIVGYGMRSGNRANSQGFDMYFIVFGFFHCPIGVIAVFNHAFCQRNGRSTRGIQFLGMVDFLHVDFVTFEFGHHFGQVLIEFKEKIHAQTKIGTRNKTSVFFLAKRRHFVVMFQPARSPRNHGYVGVETIRYVVNCSRGHTEIDGDIGSRKSVIGVEFVFFQDNFMSSFHGNPFNYLSHFSVS